MQLPIAVKNILEIINKNGGESFVVGGCVRDYYLNKTPKDYDITTSIEPNEVTSIFKKNHYNVVPTGIKHGTVTVFPKGDTEGYEITTYRTEGEYLDGRHPSSVSFTKSLEEDLSRRDLTINAMAFSPEKGLVDIFGGIEDLKNKVIKTVGNPNDRIKEDSLRMMRAIRFAAQLGFDIDEDTLKSIKINSSSINNVSKERIHDELVKIIMSDNPDYVKKLHECGLLKHFLPELSSCFFTKQNNPYHIYNVGDHTMVSLKNSEKNFILRMALLLHDIGKPDKKTTDELGIDHFIGHPEKSEQKAREVLKRLKFSTKEIESICLLVLIHDYSLENSKKAIRHFISKYSLNQEMFILFSKLKKADNMGQNLELTTPFLKKIDDIYDTYEEIMNQPLSLKDLNISGYDAINLGYKENEIGIILKKLLNLVLDNPELNTKEILIEEMKKDKG